MSGLTSDKAGWLERIDQEREAWEEMVAAAERLGMEKPGCAGAWSFKDVAGHLNGWRSRTVDRLETAARDESPPPLPWPKTADEDTDEGIEAINTWMYQRNRDRPAAEIIEETREQFQRMRSAVELMSEETLITPGRFPWLDGEPLCAILEGSFGHLHEEHEPSIRAWLAS